MSKKGVVIASAVAVAVVLTGCTRRPPPPPGPADHSYSQSGYSTKLKGHKRSRNGCKGMKRKNSCKGNSCKGNSCSEKN